MIKTAIRSIKRNKVFSLINVIGLAVGMAVFLLIAEFIASEWQANRFHRNFSNLYRVSYITKEGPNYFLPPGYAAILKENFPEVRAAVNVADGIADGVVSFSEENKEIKSFSESGISYVGGDFLDVFSFPLLHGSPSLQEPRTMAITSSMAMKIFGKEDAVGKTVLVSNQFGTTTYSVTAVLENIPENSDIKGEIFLSLSTLASAANRSDNDWADPATLQSGYANLYLLLADGAPASKLASRIDQLIVSQNPDAKGTSVFLQPFSELHLAPSLDYPMHTFGSLKLVYMLGLVALLILGIAWVNYINLSTAQALRRAKETGVRKVLGANRWQLAWQFLAETLVMTMIGAVIAAVFVQLTQPLFNRFIGKDLSLGIFAEPVFIFLILGTIITGSLLAGGYVSFVLSSFKPASTLKGKMETSTRGVLLRKGLVVFQFAISVVFIIATVVLYKQLSFMQREDLGMKLDELLVIKGPTVATEGQAERNYTFKNQLAELPFVKKISASNNIPGQGYNFSADGITRLLPSPGDDKKSYNMFIADHKFFDTYGIDIKEGRPFTENESIRSWNNEYKVVINEKAARQLGFEAGETIVGKKIMWGKEFEIIGLVKDYHHLSLRSPIEPVIYLASVSYGFFTVKTDVANMKAKLATIEKLYKSTFPGNPFEYFFADERYNRQYTQDQTLGSIFIAAAFIAIFIACLGLFGLSAFSAQQRIKEIGVRKVLGADISDITALLSKDFIKLVLVAVAIGSPVAWWLMSNWLEEFPYRTGIDWWVFVLAGLGAVVIALGTVSFQAVRAAKMDPVRSLRTE